MKSHLLIIPILLIGCYFVADFLTKPAFIEYIREYNETSGQNEWVEVPHDNSIQFTINYCISFGICLIGYLIYRQGLKKNESSKVSRE